MKTNVFRILNDQDEAYFCENQFCGGSLFQRNIAGMVLCNACVTLVKGIPEIEELVTEAYGEDWVVEREDY